LRELPVWPLGELLFCLVFSSGTHYQQIGL
jgi:hypothetical protein